MPVDDELKAGDGEGLIVKSHGIKTSKADRNMCYEERLIELGTEIRTSS